MEGILGILGMELLRIHKSELRALGDTEGDALNLDRLLEELASRIMGVGYDPLSGVVMDWEGEELVISER